MLGAEFSGVYTALVRRGFSQNHSTIYEGAGMLKILAHWPMVTITSLWVTSLIAILLFVPDHQRYHHRVEKMEMLLRANCAQWNVVKDPPFIPVHQLLVTKCLPPKV